jgi:hypothetical protein
VVRADAVLFLDTRPEGEIEMAEAVEEAEDVLN